MAINHSKLKSDVRIFFGKAENNFAFFFSVYSFTPLLNWEPWVTLIDSCGLYRTVRESHSYILQGLL